MNQDTLFLIKPNAVLHRHVGEIIQMVEQAGFFLYKIKDMRFNNHSAAEFYSEHWGKEFFSRLTEFMCSGTTIAILLEKENAMADLRKLVGDTNPSKREPRTIRALFAESITENAVHASDSPEHAKREIRLIFPELFRI